MNLLLEIQEQDIDPAAPVVDDSSFKVREAARAVVLDEDGKVALLYVGKHKYHKLPGGGIDEGEDTQSALERELLEEIGCKAEIISRLGIVIEHRNQFEMVQKSYCYKAKLAGTKGLPDFTDDEIENEFAIVWADGIDEAIELLEADDPDNYEGRFIKLRDLTFLKAAK